MRGYKTIDSMSLEECQSFLCENISQDIRKKLESQISDLEEFERLKVKKTFDNCKTIQDYQRFLKEYPKSEYKKKAEQFIDNLAFKQLCCDKSGCKSYISQFPNGLHVAEAKEIIKKKNRYSVIGIILSISIVIIILFVLAKSNNEEAIEVDSSEEAFIEEASLEEVVEECEETPAEDAASVVYFVVDFNEIVRVGPGTEYDAKYSEYCDIINNNTHSAVVYKGTKVEFLGREENNFVYVRQCYPNNDRDDWNEGWISKVHIHEL